MLRSRGRGGAGHSEWKVWAEQRCQEVVAGPSHLPEWGSGRKLWMEPRGRSNRSLLG